MMLKSRIIFLVVSVLCANSLCAYHFFPPRSLDVTNWSRVAAYLEQQGKSPENARHVNLEGRQLTEIPAWVFEKTKNITTLGLHNNHIEEIPAGIGKLRNLETLTASWNRINSVHLNIQKASRLHTIVLSTNQLDSIPSGIYRLPQLTFLYLTNNKISSVSADIQKISNLQDLDLSHNPIKSIPPGIGRLSRLQSLGLGKTSLVRLPKEIESLKGQGLHINLARVKNFAETDKGGAIGKKTLKKMFGKNIWFKNPLFGENE